MRLRRRQHGGCRFDSKGMDRVCFIARICDATGDARGLEWAERGEMTRVAWTLLRHLPDTCMVLPNHGGQLASLLPQIRRGPSRQSASSISASSTCAAPPFSHCPILLGRHRAPKGGGALEVGLKHTPVSRAADSLRQSAPLRHSGKLN